MNTSEIRILVVDDNPDVTRITARLLEQAGYSVATAPGGLEALQALQSFCPSLVLLDRDMPGIDGLQTLKKIKDAHPKLKVIMVTAVETQEKIEEAMRLGADNYITKPLSLEYLEKDVQDKIDLLSKNA